MLPLDCWSSSYYVRRNTKDGGKKSWNTTVIQPNHFSTLPFYQTQLLTKQDTFVANTTFTGIDGVDNTIYGVAVACYDGVVCVQPLTNDEVTGSMDDEASAHTEPVIEVPFDVLVAATGYSFPTITALPGQSRKDREKGIEKIAGAITSGGHVVIAGGGPTGIELAGNVLESLQRKDDNRKRKRHVGMFL